MRAIGYTEAGEASVLHEVEVPDPVPGPRDLLVEVAAVSVNPVDTKVRTRGGSEDGEPKILGYDAAGVVRAVGDEVELFGVGDEVYYAGSIARPGTDAQLHAVDERIVGAKPTSLTMAEAAALPLTAITAWELLFDRLGARVSDPDDRRTLLVVGAAGGVGSVLVQLAATLTSLRVVGTASRPETQAWVRELGADHVVDHHGDVAAQLAGLGVDHVELIAGLTGTDDHWPTYVEIVAPQGRVVLIDDPGAIDVRQLKQKSASLHWEFMFARPVHDTPDMVEQHRLLGEVARLVDDGRLRTTLTETYGEITADNLVRAHRMLESGATRGKVVLAGWPA